VSGAGGEQGSGAEERRPAWRERWCTAGCSADWLVYHGDCSAIAGQSTAGKCAVLSSARSTRHCGQAVRHSLSLLDASPPGASGE
jgi:hypothetical protein